MRKVFYNRPFENLQLMIDWHMALLSGVVYAPYIPLQITSGGF